MILLCFFIPIVVEFVNTGLVTKIPTLIVLCGLGVVIIANFFCGIILTVLKKQYKDNFERSLTILRNQYKNSDDKNSDNR